MDTPDQVTTDVVQPEGQGDGGQADAPYSEYLSRIPEEVRGEVEPVFKDWDANVTRRFQDASEYRKTWEPYEQAGVNQLSPDEVQWAIQLGQLAQQDPSAFQEWFQGYAQQAGLTPAEQQQQEAGGLEQQFSDPYQDPTQQLEQQLSKHLAPIQQQLEQFGQWREQQEHTTRMAEAERFVQGQVEELKAKHPEEFNEELVEKFIPQYIETDPRNAVQRAFADAQAFRAQIEKATLQSKVNQPAPAESGGVPDVAPEKISSLKEANKIAMQQLRGEQAA